MAGRGKAAGQGTGHRQAPEQSATQSRAKHKQSFQNKCNAPCRIAAALKRRATPADRFVCGDPSSSADDTASWRGVARRSVAGSWASIRQDTFGGHELEMVSN